MPALRGCSLTGNTSSGQMYLYILGAIFIAASGEVHDHVLVMHF